MQLHRRSVHWQSPSRINEDWCITLPTAIAHPATFSQHLAIGNSQAAALSGTYILTIEPGAEVDDFSAFAERARTRGWAYFELPTDHNPQCTMPREPSNILLTVENG